MKLWRMLRGWLILALVIGGLYALLYYLWFAPQPVPVRVHRVMRGLVEATVTNTKAGSLRSRLSTELSPEAAGLVMKIHHREGARVKKGEALLSLDDRDATASLAVAQKDLSSALAVRQEAKARAEDAARELGRFAELAKQGTVPQAQLDQARTQANVAAAALQAAEARVELQQARLDRARLEISKCTLASPFNGVIGDLYVEVGEWAVPGKPVLKLLDPDQIYVHAVLDEVDLGRIQDGLPVRVTLDPYREHKLTGKIVRIAPFVSEIEQQNRTVEIEVELAPTADGLVLKPGTSADVEVILEQHPDVLRLPTLALLEGNRVLRVHDGEAVEGAVKIGLKNWEYAEILEGLNEGDALIVSLESDQVKPGVKVAVVEESQR